MKLKNLFAKRLTVAEGFRMSVSRHFFYSTFGVRDRYEIIARTGNYICTGTPGTGFFVHSSESHTYHRFVSAERKKTKQNLATLLLGKEPDFDKENRRIEKAFSTTDNADVKRILTSYQNVIALAKEEEQLQRVVRSVKDQMEGRPDDALSSILSHYKSIIATLEHDVRATQIQVCDGMNEAQLTAWQKVIEAFHLLVSSRRIWSVYTDNALQAYAQVFFDMAVFDYIRSPYDTPLMRDHAGRHFYIYPLGIVEARSSVDFSVYRWSELNVRFGVVDISTLSARPHFDARGAKGRKRRHTDAISNLYGTTRNQVVGEITIPELGLRFYVNHTGPAEDFVRALNEFLNVNQ